MFAGLPEASNFVGRRAAKVPWIYGSLFSWSEMHFRLLELPFEITLFGDPACYFLGEIFSTRSSSYMSFPEIELDPLTGGGRLLDPSCFTSSLEDFGSSVARGISVLSLAGDFQKFLRSRNVRIVRWKLWEHLDILGGSIVFVSSALGFVYWIGEHASQLVILFTCPIGRSQVVSLCFRKQTVVKAHILWNLILEISSSRTGFSSRLGNVSGFGTAVVIEVDTGPREVCVEIFEWEVCYMWLLVSSLWIMIIAVMVGSIINHSRSGWLSRRLFDFQIHKSSSQKSFVINACKRPKGAQGIVFDILEILRPL
ncbi:hypothetical protein F2Q69_00053564 [Brassica cretica]|uniref:Uncharacterized protein n=1 Tax=Brassica cretica TaxID=69181 RepID=A0A8S9N723_BRACR|nr:hypothetical protein F2Q69_00053564 [Brassica cretica]